DRVPKVLGYSDHGSFDGDNLPPQLKAMMEQWATQMSKLPESSPRHASWDNAVSTRAGGGILMETAEWGQGYPYNVLCPVIDGEQSPTGCVSTAMAIAMKYHNWPDYTRGGIQKDFNYPEFSFDFDDYAIDWSVLDDKTNPKFANEVGKLMYTTGVTAQMVYGPYESSAEMWPLGHKMVELYTYAKGCQYIEKEKFSDDEWNNMLVEQLQEVGPVIYRGSGSIGHAFVIDGYDGAALFHVNWGWDGLLNGYYTLDFSDVGGSSFAEDQGMIINIKPDKERREYSKSFISNCDVYIGSTNGSEGLNFFSPDITPGVWTMFKLPTLTLNGHVGYYDIAVVDQDDNILQVLGMQSFNNDPERYCPYPGMTLQFPVMFPGLKEGQRYQAVSMEADLAEDGFSFATPRSEDPKDWKLILGGIVYPSHFYDHGNRSVLSKVRFHIDKNMPVVFPLLVTQDKEFTLYELRGGGCADNILIPKKGVTMEIKSTDKNGNPEELFSVGTVGDDGLIELNISMYSDIFDVYLKYEYDGDTRNDKGMPAASIIVQDGLVYKIVEDGVSLIGYDKIGNNVVIPDSISSGGSVFKVTSIENEALLYAPIKNLTIRTSADLGSFAFSGIDNLETISFEGGTPPNSWYFPFMDTKIQKVYFDKVEQTVLMYKVMSLNYNEWGEISKACVYSDNIDFYLSEVGPLWDWNTYINGINAYGIGTALNEGWIDKAMSSYNIPGIGNDERFSYMCSNCPVNIRQMWNYALDRKHNLIKIEPLIEEIKITSVSVNGIEITGREDFIYEVPSSENIELIVNYILNGNKEMSSVYSAEYNAELPEQTLSIAMGDSNDDGIITIADAVNAANYIIGLPTTDFAFELADMNEDGDITISDVTSIISLIPAQSYVKQSDFSPLLAKAVPFGYLVSSMSEVSDTVEFSVVSDEDLTALQFDVRFPTGVDMPEFKLSDAFVSSHILQQFNLDINTVRVIVYSTSGKQLTNSDSNSVVTLRGVTSPTELVVKNIFASDACGASLGLDFEDLGVSNAVSGSSVAALEVKVDVDMLVVNNASGNIVAVYALDGRCVGTYAVDTDRFEINLRSGMYIVTVGNNSHRVIIK
ncbi:MAG: C10 family peptidase, partial [Muribaculaceae bacterium]|nr:C10 family peptidase [Muribaculaceae bacterium]